MRFSLFSRMLLVAFLFTSCVSAGESISKDVVFSFGVPVAKEKVIVLKNIGYVVGYSEEHKNPLWVAFRLDFPIRHEDYVRDSFFNIDERTKSLVSTKDYENSGFSRGHMAPSVTMYAYFGEPAEKESFFMSNVVPQYQLNNVGCWKHLETLTGHGKENYVATYKTIYVLCGPVFPKKPEQISDKKIDVPNYIYKILIRDTSSPLFLPFLMPNVNDKKETEKKLDDYLVSVDSIQKQTDIDFFPQLPDKFKKILLTKPTKLWDLSK